MPEQAPSITLSPQEIPLTNQPPQPPQPMTAQPPLPPKLQPATIEPHDLDEREVLARTLWGEDRGAGIGGMEAVASVIMNRVGAARAHVEETGKPHPLYGDGTFKSCCLKFEQFSCWLPNDPNYHKMVAADWDTLPGASDALTVADDAVSWELHDPTDGATYYYSADMRKAPSWAGSMRVACAIYGLVFCKPMSA